MEQHSIACRCTVEYAVECGRIASTIVQESLLARRAKRDKRRCSCATRAKTLTPWCDTSKDSHTMSDWHLFGVLHVDACYYIYIHACVWRVACQSDKTCQCNFCVTISKVIGPCAYIYFLTSPSIDSAHITMTSFGHDYTMQDILVTSEGYLALISRRCVMIHAISQSMSIDEHQSSHSHMRKTSE